MSNEVSPKLLEAQHRVTATKQFMEAKTIEFQGQVLLQNAVEMQRVREEAHTLLDAYLDASEFLIKGYLTP